MTIEELLAPRYKVIADYPNSRFDIGRIFIRNNNSWHNEDKSTSYGLGMVPNFQQYPHLFQKLEWWEKREDKDMPEYVKNKKGKVYRVADKSQNGRIYHVDGEIEFRFIRDSWYTPATKKEFETQNK